MRRRCESWTASANFGAATRRRVGRAVRGSAPSACRASSSARSSSRRRGGCSRSLLADVEVGRRQARRGAPRAGRAAPRCRAPRRVAPSHFSSSRSGSSHSGSSSGRNVRRSERSRRVATRAWWTSSGSLAEAHAGSWASSREGRRGDRRLHDVGRGGREVELRRRRDVGCDRARAARARARSSGRVGLAGAGGPEPGRRRGVDELRRHVRRRTRPRARGTAPPGAHAVEHRHLVVDDLADLRPSLVAQHDTLAHGVEARDRAASGALRASACTRSSAAVGRIAVGVAVEVQLRARRARPSAA